MAISPQKPHAILVSYPLQGHVIPSVHLAIKLASRGFTITFINTQSIHNQITSGDKSINGQGDIFSKVRKSGLDIRYTTVPDGLPLGFDRSLTMISSWLLCCMFSLLMLRRKFKRLSSLDLLSIVWLLIRSLYGLACCQRNVGFYTYLFGQSQL